MVESQNSFDKIKIEPKKEKTELVQLVDDSISTVSLDDLGNNYEKMEKVIKDLHWHDGTMYLPSLIILINEHALKKDSQGFKVEGSDFAALEEEKIPDLKGKNILEFGFGEQPYFLEWATNRGANIIGVEQFNILPYIQKMNKKYNNLTLYHDSFANLGQHKEIKENSFDYITSSAVLTERVMDITEGQDVYKTALRYLKENGLLIVANHSIEPAIIPSKELDIEHKKFKSVLQAHLFYSQINVFRKIAESY